MNKMLTSQIVRHIFSNFMIIPSDFVDVKKTKSLMSNDFLLSEKLIFELEDGEILKNKVWGCQIPIEHQEVRILLGDCSQEKNISEYCLLIQLKNSPTYGLYLAHGDSLEEVLIACTLNGKDWITCNTFLQATFLAATEQIKDFAFTWDKCSKYQEQYKILLEFIKYHDSLLESNHEG